MSMHFKGIVVSLLLITAVGISVTSSGSVGASGACRVTVYATNNSGADVTAIDAATNTVIGSPIAVGNSPRDVAITPDGNFAYITNSNSDTVSVVSTATNTVGATVSVGPVPLNLAITPDGNFVYVVAAGSNNSTDPHRPP